MEPSEDPRSDDEGHNPYRSQYLVQQQGGRRDGFRHGPHVNSGVEVGGNEDEAQYGEEHPGPDGLQSDEG
jgi:hypothetical protein